MANSLTHVLPYPIKNARFTLALPFRVSNGTPTDPTTPDTEFSSDGGATFSDCAEEITTGGTNGQGYLTLTGAETNNNLLQIAAKSANCLTTPATLYPRSLATIGSGTLSAGSSTGGTLGTILAYDLTGCFIRTTGGTGGGGTGGANNQARRILTYTVSTGAFTVDTWETTPNNTTTYDILLPEGVTIGMLKTLRPTTDGRQLTVDTSGVGDANPTKWNGTAVATPDTAGYPKVTIKSGTGIGEIWFPNSDGVVGAYINEIATSAIKAASFQANAITAAVIATDAIGAAELAADAVAEIVTGVLTTQMTESYNADGTAPTLAQVLFLISQMLTEFAISGTTLTVKKLNGTTTAATFTLDSATSPTSITRAS